MNEIFEKKEFAIETVATGSFLDNVGGAEGKTWQADTAVIRLNHIALSEYQEAKDTWGTGDFETKEEYAGYMAEQAAKQEAFEQKMKGALGWDGRDASFSLTRNVSEIFTAVRIWEATE